MGQKWASKKTIVMPKVLIFNAYLFVMGIQLLMAHAIHFQAVVDHTTLVFWLQMECPAIVAVRTWSSSSSLLA